MVVRNGNRTPRNKAARLVFSKYALTNELKVHLHWYLLRLILLSCLKSLKKNCAAIHRIAAHHRVIFEKKQRQKRICQR